MTEVATTPQQVPLDTIPISPDGANGEASSNEGNGAVYTDSNPITVFHDNANFNVKHPLMHRWTLWFTKPPTGKVSADRDRDRDHECDCDGILTSDLQSDNWNDLLKQVITFDSVEEFWGIYVSFLPIRLPFSFRTDHSHAEQYLPCLRTRTQVRLPPLQGKRQAGVGRSPEQAWRQVGIPVQGQEERLHRQPLAACNARCHRRNARRRRRR